MRSQYNQIKKKQLANFIKNTKFVKLKTPPTFLMTNNPDTTPDTILCTENIIKNFSKIELSPDLGADHLAIGHLHCFMNPM